jgi:hypothetical protein
MIQAFCDQELPHITRLTMSLRRYLFDVKVVEADRLAGYIVW